MVSANDQNAEIASQGKFNCKEHTVQIALVRRMLLYCETNFDMSNIERKYTLYEKVYLIMKT